MRGTRRRAGKGTRLLPDLAQLAVERVGVPIAWLDERTRILMVTPALESLVGRDRAALVGRSWRESLAPSSTARDSAASLRAGLTGARGAAELVVVGASGERLALSCGLQTFSLSGGRKVLAVEVRTSRRADACEPFLGLAGDARYQVRARPDFGTVLAYESSDPAEKAELFLGRPCHLAIHGLTEPCAGCPALAPLAPGHTRASLLGRLGRGGEFLYRAARGLVDGTVVIDAHTLPGNAFEQMVEASVADRTRGTSLTARERAVLGHVVLGRSQKEIAEALGIALGTVKFHQGNLLRKLDLVGTHAVAVALLSPRSPDAPASARRQPPVTRSRKVP